MGILDPAKLAVIFVIAFLVLGPDRLPELARRFGSTLRRISDTRAQAEHELRAAVSGLELPSLDRLEPAKSASKFLADLTRFPEETEPGGAISGARVLEAVAFEAEASDPSQAVGIGRIPALSGSGEETSTAANTTDAGAFDVAMN